MGSRGAFANVYAGDFSFVENGKKYVSIGTLNGDPNIKVLVQDSDRVKAPEYSHTAGRIYAIVKDGVLKHLAYYDENHDQSVVIDLSHTHKGVQPHRHVYLNHDKKSPGIPPTEKEIELINRIKKEFNLL